MELLLNMDLKFLEFLQNNLQSDISNQIFYLITKLGDIGLIWFVISFVLIFNKKYRKVGISAIFALILASFLGEVIIKDLVQRPRPFIEYDYFKTILSHTSGYSFPSGHTASSFAAAVILSNGIRKYKIVFLTLASLIAFSRLALFLHYPSDIIGGILLGLLCAWITLKVNIYLNTIRKKDV